MTQQDRDARNDEYAQAQLCIADVDGRGLLLRPRPEPGGQGRFPFAADAVHVITAFDPGPERLSPDENQRRQDSLVAELPGEVEWWVAVTGAADGSHEETCVVAEGLSDEQALRLGATWGQDAIFRWTRHTWSVLPCDDGAAVHLGWELEELDGRSRSDGIPRRRLPRARPR